MKGLLKKLLLSSLRATEDTRVTGSAAISCDESVTKLRLPHHARRVVRNDATVVFSTLPEAEVSSIFCYQLSMSRFSSVNFSRVRYIVTPLAANRFNSS